MGALLVPPGVDHRNKEQTRWPNCIFKHKYLTQPSITASEALLMTSKDIYNALQNITPPTRESCSAINFIVDMFSGKTRQERSDVDIQRRPKQKAYSQMVMSEENETASNEPSQMVPVKVAS